MACIKTRIAGFHTIVAALVLSTFMLLPDGVKASTAGDFITIAKETVSTGITAKNGFAWHSGYDIEVREGKVLVHVAINLIPVDGVSRPILDRVRGEWERGIEQTWGGQYSLVTPNGERYPILIDVTFRGRRFHHDVIVRPGAGGSDELNWNVMDSPEIAAHEFGHMIGVYDEYKRGAVALEMEILDNTSIMTSNPSDGATYGRHYEQFREWFAARTGLNDTVVSPAIQKVGVLYRPLVERRNLERRESRTKI